MKTKTINNNIGAISALKGYRVQFLYSLSRILSFKKTEMEFHPEGKLEDLDIYNENGDVIEIIQVKDLGNVLTLSDITTSKTKNTFLKRAIKAYKENKRPKIKLVSFGEINDDVKNLSNPEYSQKLIKKLNKLGLSISDIELLRGNFDYEIVNEQNIKENVISNIEKWGSFTDTKITIDLLTYWIYYAAEKQHIITPVKFKEQFDKICKFQNERISFNKTYNSLIQPLDGNIESENIEHLKSDFYKGISATYNHILANVDVVRVEKIQSISEKFNKSNIVFIHGASGQGKSTLAYRYIYENCSGATVFELKYLPEDISVIYEVVNSLEGISKGIRFPITIYIDVEPGNKKWINILTELASKKNFRFLITIREEDWNSIEVGDKFSFSEIELLFEQEEAKLIYESLEEYNEDLKFTDFDNAWDTFGAAGPLLEFTYLITQNESLSAKLKSQINNIRNSSVNSNEKIKLLRYIVLADCFGSKIKLKELSQFLQFDDILYLIDLLQKEYLIKISGDKTHITGLHPVRSEIIKGLLFDNEINVESDYVLEAISFISDNTFLFFLRNAFKRSNLSIKKLQEKLKDFTPQKWQTYFEIFKSLLWKGIDDYVNKNENVLNRIYSDHNKSWTVVVDFDYANVMGSGGMMATSGIFTDEQKQYAQTINKEFSDKQEVFSYCLKWLNNIKQIHLVPNSENEWNAFGLFLFWLQHLKKTDTNINFEEFDIELTLSMQPLYVLAHVLYAFKKFNKKSLIYADKVEQVFMQKLSKTFNVISIEQVGGSINCYYLFDIIDEEVETEETDFMNAKSMKIIDLLRFAFPDKENYGAKGVGHQFSFLPDNHDFSKKQIPKKNIPLKPLVEINSTYINLFNYTKRPKTWQDYATVVINRRLLLVEVLTKMVKAFNLSHKLKNLHPLSKYAHDYTVNYHSLIKKETTPLLPQLIIDEWGGYSEGSTKKIKSNFAPLVEKAESKEIKQMLSISKYNSYIGLYRDFDNSIESFLWQSAQSIFRKIKIFLKEDIPNISDNSRVSLVGNLYRTYEFAIQYQNSFRTHFAKFVDPLVLKKLENEEQNSISTLCFLYRQFIYSDTFLNGNISKLALNRLIDTNLSFKKKISSGFKLLSKEFDIQIDVHFEENEKRCVIIANHNNTFESLELLEIFYNKLFVIIGQPDSTSIKHLLINTKYPVFNILLLISGKTINSKWYQFKTSNLREKSFEELAQFNLIPQEIPKDIIEKYNIYSWNKILKDFQNLDKLLESISTAYHLAFHFSQLEYFKDKTVEEFNENILIKHINKTSNLLQENLQTALDLFSSYADMCNNGKIKFNDDYEKLDFYELLIENHRYFYPNDELFEKKEFNLSLRANEMKEWILRLEMLVNCISIVYYFLAGKIIEGKVLAKQ